MDVNGVGRQGYLYKLQEAGWKARKSVDTITRWGQGDEKHKPKFKIIRICGIRHVDGPTFDYFLEHGVPSKEPAL